MKRINICLNATMPVFLLMILGYVFRRVGVIDLEFADKMNRFVFFGSFACAFIQGIVIV